MWNSIKNIGYLATPIMMSYGVAMLFSLVDTLYAGILGGYAITAISYFVPLEFIFLGVYVGAQSACTVYFSRSLGANNMFDLKEYYAAAKRLIQYLAIGMVILFFLVFFATFFLPFSENVLHGFRDYSLVRIVGMILFMLPMIVINAVLRSHRKMRQTMNSQVIGNIGNIILNTIFVFVFHWGIFGIAFATLLAQGISLFIAYGYVKEFPDFIEIISTKVQLQKEYFKQLVSLTFLSGFRDLLIAGEMFVVTLILTTLSEDAVGANGILFRYGGFAIIPLIGTFTTMNTVFGYHLGKKDYESIRMDMKAANIFTIAVMLFIFFPLYYFFDDFMVRVITDSENIAQYTITALKYIPLIFIVLTPFMIFHSFAQTLHNKSMLINIPLIRYIILSIPCMYIANKVFGFIGLTIIAPITLNLIADSIYYFRYKKWVQKAFSQPVPKIVT